MEQLSPNEILQVNGGNLLALILGAVCAVGDYLSNRYTDEVYNTINEGNIGDLVD